MTRAVNFAECPASPYGRRGCRCGKCAICGYPKHTAVHGPYWKDGKLIDKPYGHEFKPIAESCTKLNRERLERCELRNRHKVEP